MTEERLKKRLNPAPGDTSRLAPYTGNMTQCWRCSHCKWVPAPKSKQFAFSCPSIEWGGFHSYSGGGKVISAFALKEGKAEYTEKAAETIFACTACGACDTSCKSNNGDNVEPLEVMYTLRATIADEGKSPEAHKSMVQNLRENNNPAGKPKTERGAWANGLPLKDARSTEVDVLLHIGCDNAYDESSWKELHAIVKLLNLAEIDFGILFEGESPTGEMAFDLGFQDDASAQANSMLETFNTSNAKRIVTCSAASYAGVRNIWPFLNIEPPTKPFSHITDFISELIEDGRLVLKAKLSEKVTYHDPCKLGRLSEPRQAYDVKNTKWTKANNTIAIREIGKPSLFGNHGLYDSPRRLLEAIDGLELVEMERNRFASYCCGAGGGAKEAYPEFAKFAGKKRLDEAEATGASRMVTACGKCQSHMSDVSDSQAIKPVGLFELIIEAMLGNTGAE